MILTLQRHLHDAIVDAIGKQFGLADVPPFAVEVPPNRGLGDLAVTVAFQLARILKKPPKAIAEQLRPAVASVAGVARADVAPNGYLNVFLAAAFRRAGLAEDALLQLLQEEDPSSIKFGDAGVTWRGNLADVQCLDDTRKSLAVSFGSCSFTEPVNEARQLHLI